MGVGDPGDLGLVSVLGIQWMLCVLGLLQMLGLVSLCV